MKGVHSWRSFRKWATEKDSSIITHQLNDLAVVKLDRPVVGVTPASITTWRNTDLYEKNVTLIGWTAGQSGKVRFMKKARVQIYQLPTEFCVLLRTHSLSAPGGGSLLEENNDICGVNQGFAPTGSLNCTEDFADQHRFNFHLDFIDEYRQFIDEIKANQTMLEAESMRGHNMRAANIQFVASLAAKRNDSVLDGDHFCSGSLIAKNLVLTSAHCLNDGIHKKFDIVFGAEDLRGATPKYEVHSWITFDDWAVLKGPRISNLQFRDIAIIQLERPVDGVTPANIATLRKASIYGKDAWMVGWNNGPNDVSRYMRIAKVQILPSAVCEDRIQLVANLAYPISDGLMCTAANPYTLMTLGDSGGPLLDENNNILGVNLGFCPFDTFNCTEDFADEHRFNIHVDFIDEYRQYIEETRAMLLNP